ncbi:heat shock protein beta-11-like [Lethenteron reissneri]|uniref:heat shock protein beta-11-like n=1 Tax=Lethenteron reissneri TaxID=7753 RepID=UPI002AB6226A|nr:heat shock protein beta-11-like [Lethenteron reissneri]
MALNVFFPPMHVLEKRLWPGWPILSLPGREDSMFQQLQREMNSEIERMERIFQWVEQLSSQMISKSVFPEMLQQPPISRIQIEAPQEQGDGFVACLDVQQFSPEDLAVKVSGDKLVVAGRHEVKSGEGSSGNYRHSCQEFREEMQLPRDVDPQSVSCSMTADGKLKIKAQRRALPAAGERVVAIEVQRAPPAIAAAAAGSPADGSPAKIPTSE